MRRKRATLKAAQAKKTSSRALTLRPDCPDSTTSRLYSEDSDLDDILVKKLHLEGTQSSSTGVTWDHTKFMVLLGARGF